MPELAEVEFYRSQWDAGMRARVERVHLHPEKRVFRGTRLEWFEEIAGQRLRASEAQGKQMLFRFSGELWLGVHLGMTGKLSCHEESYNPGKHDHLVLFQSGRALVFNDPRQFGRLLIHRGAAAPEWWSKIPPSLTSDGFTFERMSQFLARRARLPLKATLLVQQGFPGVGNWMADEILWRAALAPARLCASLTPSERKRLWRETRFVSREALRHIGKDFSDPPARWLFHERWSKGGICPKHKTPLLRATIGGRTTAWCPKCQG